jgi:hypothetical protein
VPDDKCWAILGGTAKFTKSGPLSVEDSLPMEEITWWVPNKCEFRSDNQVSARVGSLRIAFDDLITVTRNVTDSGIVLHNGNLKGQRHSRCSAH